MDSCSGTLRSSSFVPPLLTDTGVSTSLLSDTESLFADVDSCDEDEELSDIPKSTNGT